MADDKLRMIAFGMRVITDPDVPPDEVQIRDTKTGEILGRLVGLPVPAHPEGSR